MKKFTVLPIMMILLLIAGNAILAQNYVSTEPQNKNAILEEFTGVRCPNCPAGHQVIASILQNNPGRAFCVAYHPSNSSYTQPYGSDPDFRRTYPNAFYSTPYCGSSRFMPSSFIQRREWNGEKIQSRTVWTQYANTIMAESSPLNVGMASTYNPTTKMLDVTVEIYFTETVQQEVRLYVTLAENDLIAQQSGGSASYVHKHVFREAFVAQWGDQLRGSTAQGSLVVMNYSFDNSNTGYIMDNCELLAFVVNYNSEEVISGVGVDVGEHTTIPPTADFSAADTTVGLGMTVVFTDQSSGDPTEWEWTFDGGDPDSSSLQNPPPVMYNTIGNYSVTLSVSNAAGQSEVTRTDYIVVGYAPESDFEADNTNIVEGETVQFTDLSTHDPLTWAWSFPGGDPDASNEQTPPAIKYDVPGEYNVTLMTSNEFGESILAKEAYIHVGGVGLHETNPEGNIVMYPNPCNDALHIEFNRESELNEVKIITPDGKNVMNIPVNSGKVQMLTMDVSQFQNGVYFVVIQDDASTIIRKIIKTH